MKTTIQINGKPVEIELTAEQVEAITKATKDEFNPEYECSYMFSTFGIVTRGNSKLLENSKYCNYGNLRDTQALAEIAYKNSKARNKLEELVHWLEHDWQPDWKDDNQDKCYIYYNTSSKLFGFSSYTITISCTAVCMSEETADKICTALNDGKLPELAEILKA